jgi:hypothetical protein
LGGLLKRKKFVSAGQRRHAREQDVLNVVELKHSKLLIIDQTNRGARDRAVALHIFSVAVTGALPQSQVTAFDLAFQLKPPSL